VVVRLTGPTTPKMSDEVLLVAGEAWVDPSRHAEHGVVQCGIIALGAECTLKTATTEGKRRLLRQRSTSLSCS
jgi:hypothetical protein